MDGAAADALNRTPLFRFKNEDVPRHRWTGWRHHQADDMEIVRNSKQDARNSEEAQSIRSDPPPPPSSAGRPLVRANATAAAATKNKTTTLMDNETLMECGMNAIRFDMSFKTRSAEIPLQTRGPFHSKQDKNVALHLCLVVTAAGWPRHGYF